jgi:polysaccharide pyruvyl transferase WcaK-like protein
MFFDADAAVAHLTNFTVGASRFLPHSSWKPSEKLRLLVVGYNGRRNTGSDARVESMVRQFYAVLGPQNVDIGVVTLDAHASAPYFPAPTRQVEISPYYFAPLAKACSDHHLVILSEGGTLKTNFSASLLCFFSEAAGVMKRQGKPSLAYGVEAGQVDPRILKLIGGHFDETLFLARTRQSALQMAEYGYSARVGTDTAWVFEPAPKAWALAELNAKLGWTGDEPLVGVSVINPYWWPVRPDLKRFFSGARLTSPEYHYDRFYFMTDTQERRAKFRAYLEAVARCVNRLASELRCKVAVFGMEGLDLHPCQELSKLLEPGHHVFSSRQYDAYQVTALLRCLSILVTSRYHAHVLSIPAGVPAVAVSIDERLANLMEELGTHGTAYVRADDPDLQTRLDGAIQRIWTTRAAQREEILNSVAGYLGTMASMGRELRRFVAERFHGFPLPPEPMRASGYLPPLSDELVALARRRRQEDLVA